MNTTNTTEWHPSTAPPPINGTYLCDIGDTDPVIMAYIDGHWKIGLPKTVIKDEWVLYWTHLPEQIR